MVHLIFAFLTSAFMIIIEQETVIKLF